MARKINGVQVFSATMVRDREVLGDRVTEWLQARPNIEIDDIVVTQSSDNQFHCITVAVLYNEPAKAKR